MYNLMLVNRNSTFI